jgi:hypothetical protein
LGNDVRAIPETNKGSPIERRSKPAAHIMTALRSGIFPGSAIINAIKIVLHGWHQVVINTKTNRERCEM